MVIAPFLWYSRVLKIDYILLIHPKGRHMNDLRFITKIFGAKELKELNTNINGVIISGSNNKDIPLKLYYKGISIIFVKDISRYKEKAKNAILVFLPYVKNNVKYNKIMKNKPKICIILGAKGKKLDLLYSQLKRLGCEIYSTHKDGAIQVKIKERGKIKIEMWGVSHERT